MVGITVASALEPTWCLKRGLTLGPRIPGGLLQRGRCRGGLAGLRTPGFCRLKTSTLSLKRRDSVNILLFIVSFPRELLFLSCKFLLLSTHLFIPTHPPSKLLLPHSGKMAILQSSKAPCMWKGCRIRHVSLCVKQRDVLLACVHPVP